jgi:hypothetical protein
MDSSFFFGDTLYESELNNRSGVGTIAPMTFGTITVGLFSTAFHYSLAPAIFHSNKFLSCLGT